MAFSFLPPLENCDGTSDLVLLDYIHNHSKDFEFFFNDHLTSYFRLGHGEVCYLCGFADGVRFYEALKKGEFDHGSKR